MFSFSKSNHPNLLKLFKGAKNLYSDLPAVRRHRRKRFIWKVFKIFLSVIGILLLMMIILVGANFLAIYDLTRSAMSGAQNLQSAVERTKARDFDQAVVKAGFAETDFAVAEKNLAALKNGLLIGSLPYAGSQLTDAAYLVNTAELLSRATKQGATFGRELVSLTGGNELSYDRLTEDQKKLFLSKIYESGPELSGIKANLELALVNLGQLNISGPLLIFKSKIINLRGKVLSGVLALDQAIPLARLVPELFGYPRAATYLVMMQNNDELRPTGGFLGTYGILEMENGEINRFDTHDIYHLDMPVKDSVAVTPPDPISKYLNKRWYLRDANWSPDWPTAAKQIEWFYGEENSKLPPKDSINNFAGKFNGVIGVTPKLVTDLLSMLGPVEIEGETYTEKNFTQLLEYRVEKGYVDLGIPSWHRKEVIGDIVKELKIRLLDLPLDRWQEASLVLRDNLSRKDLLVYLSDPIQEQLVLKQNWGGEVKDTAGDFLMVVDANLGSLKTDPAVKRRISYTVKEQSDGLYSSLRLDYMNNGSRDWRTTDYKTYTRIFVPAGSRLVSIEGIKADEVAAYEESGKTCFAFYLKVPLGEARSLTLYYKLPDRLGRQLEMTGNYGFYAQKQPGRPTDELTFDLVAANSIESYNPVGFSAELKSPDSVGWISDFNTDKYFIVNTDN